MNKKKNVSYYQLVCNRIYVTSDLGFKLAYFLCGIIYGEERIR